MKVGLVFFGLSFAIGVFSVNAWDIAVAVKDHINFLNRTGELEGQLSEGLEEVRALAYNAELRQMYFVDNERSDGTIFQLTVPKNMSIDNTTAEVQVIVSKQGQEVKGLAYDDMTGVLYWTVLDSPAIMFVKVDPSGPSSKPQAGQRLLSLPGQRPLSLAIDICKRYLYWSNTAYKNASIERLHLDGSGDHTTIVNKDLARPNAVVVDQAAGRLFWVDERPGAEFRIDSSDLEGNDRRILHSGADHQPFALAVSSGSVFWTDHIKNSVWGLELDAPRLTPPSSRQLATYPFSPRALVSAHMGHWQSGQCNKIVAPKMVTIPATVTRISGSAEQPAIEHVAKTNISRPACLHEGLWREDQSYCDCPSGYSGIYCEVDECQGYCLHGGRCRRQVQGPECICAGGYSGPHCEESVCHNYCIAGHCSVDVAGQPQCHCQEGYTGLRCEVNYTQQQGLKHDFLEVCQAFCRLWAESEKDNIQPFDVCSCSETDKVASLEMEWNRDHILLALLAMCLVLMLVIAVLTRKVLLLRKRPRVKKRIIVNKSVTPLTCRPSPSGGDQCEITIENCCNMNICETPCFEPDFRHPPATLSKQNNKGVKEEKKTLLGSMELPPDDLY